MALQGTLDTFELPEVLRLLASTKKSGRLTLATDRGHGEVQLSDGGVVSVTSTGVPGGAVADGLFDLLRGHGGSFTFEAEDPAGDASTAAVEPMLAEAETRLVEWRAIETVVPSLDAWVALAPELPVAELTIDAATWRLVATVGSGTSVAELGRDLELAEVPLCRLIRDLVELGLGVVTAAAPLDAVDPGASTATAGLPASPEPEWTPAASAPWTPEVAPAAPPATDAAPARDVVVAAPVGDTYLHPVPASESFGGPEPARHTDNPFDHADHPSHAASHGEPHEESDDEVARQLAMLSPRAARAVAVAAAAATPDERDAALSVLDESDEPVNRGLLLKFLGSVKS